MKLLMVKQGQRSKENDLGGVYFEMDIYSLKGFYMEGDIFLVLNVANTGKQHVALYQNALRNKNAPRCIYG